MDDLQRRHAQVAGTVEERFLLAGNQGDGNQVALPELPYGLEQLQQMQAAAATIAAADASSSCGNCSEQGRASTVLCGKARVPHGQVYPVHRAEGQVILT